MTVEEFYGDDGGQTNFVDRISAFLGISTDRMKIVGIVDYSSARFRHLQTGGGIGIISEIQEDGAIGDEDYDPAASFVELRDMANDLTNEINTNPSMNIGFNAQVLGVETELVVSPGAGDPNARFTEADLNAQNNSSDDDEADYTWAAIVFPILGVIIIVVIVVVVKK